MPNLTAPLDEARENLRVIRQTMERSTQYSTLSGISGVLVGLAGIGGVAATWGVWMFCYGIAICAVGLFSVRPVTFLGFAFVIAGAITLLIPAAPYHLIMMAITFGGFHILYGILMARRHGW